MKLTVDSDVDSEATNECQVFLRKCFLAKLLVSKHDGREVLCDFCFIQISAKISPNKSKTANFNGFFWCKYILKTDAVLDHLLGGIYAKFFGSHEHPQALIVL